MPQWGQWYKGRIRERRLTRAVLLDFQRYIRTVALPRSDRLLLAAMVAKVAPEHNSFFDLETFLRGCDLWPVDAQELTHYGPV